MKRFCVSGTFSKCSYWEKTKTGTCKELGTALPDCKKQVGQWKTYGACESVGSNTSCGVGRQTMSRTCIDGTTDICRLKDTNQTVSCDDAGTSLPGCLKTLDSWRDVGECNPITTNDTCGLRVQTQSRLCINGTSDKCTADDTLRKIPCKKAETELQHCSCE